MKKQLLALAFLTGVASYSGAETCYTLHIYNQIAGGGSKVNWNYNTNGDTSCGPANPSGSLSYNESVDPSVPAGTYVHVHGTDSWGDSDTDDQDIGAEAYQAGCDTDSSGNIACHVGPWNQ